MILARVGTHTWQRLAPIAGPAPKNSAHPGRVHVVRDGTAHQCWSAGECQLHFVI